MSQNAHLQMLFDIRTADEGGPVPGKSELSAHLQSRLNAVGDKAFSEFAYVQQVASKKWGAERTAHFGEVLRRYRVLPKPVRKTCWQQATEAVLRLPAEWQSPLLDVIAISKAGRKKKGIRLWSAAHMLNVARALNRWACFCRETATSTLPTGASLDRFGQHLIRETSDGLQMTTRSAADYLARVLSGIECIEEGFASSACAFVSEDWCRRAQSLGSTTKTGSQLVSAVTLYDLGFEHIETAKSQAQRGLSAARLFRNGLILALGVALPQRARALRCLCFGNTVELPDAHSVHVKIPAAMLKLPEARKLGAPFERNFVNPRLAAALMEYQRSFRPIFDEGDVLFPSVMCRHVAISEKQISRLTGDMTQKAFGVRIPIHRVRDNVATDASEQMRAGGRAAASLLGHRSEKTVARHYDHSDGLAAANAFGELLASYRVSSVALEI